VVAYLSEELTTSIFHEYQKTRIDIFIIVRTSKSRPRRRWEDGIRMDLEEIGWGGVKWIHLAQNMDRWLAVVNAVMNLRVLGPRS
jgi:hypothetical protein